MRFGYGITGNAEFLKKLKSKQIPWSLNSLGAFAGELLFQDKDYIKKTRNLILSEREYMYTKLRELPFFYVYPAYANFLLVQIQKDGLTSSDVFEACIREGLMIRDCSSFTGLEGEFVRFCIMDPEYDLYTENFHHERKQHSMSTKHEMLLFLVYQFTLSSIFLNIDLHPYLRA